MFKPFMTLIILDPFVEKERITQSVLWDDNLAAQWRKELMSNYALGTSKKQLIFNMGAHSQENFEKSQNFPKQVIDITWTIKS